MFVSLAIPQAGYEDEDSFKRLLHRVRRALRNSKMLCFSRQFFLLDVRFWPV